MQNRTDKKKSVDSSKVSTYTVDSTASSIKSKSSRLFKKVFGKNDAYVERKPQTRKSNIIVITEYMALR